MYQSNGAIGARTPAIMAGQNTIARDAYSYDYVTVETNEKFAMEYVDCYEALGFELVKNERALALKIALTFKRNRKIENKDRLNKIQCRLDEALNAVNKLERNKEKLPFTAAMGLGTAGALAFGGGVSLCLLSGAVGAIIGGIVLSLAGAALAGLGYIAYKKLFAKKSQQMNALIDTRRDEISSLCEEAQSLL